MFVNHCGDISTSPASNDLSRPVTINSPIAIRNSPRACFIALLVADMPPRQFRQRSGIPESTQASGLVVNPAAPVTN